MKIDRFRNYFTSNKKKKNQNSLTWFKISAEADSAISGTGAIQQWENERGDEKIGERVDSDSEVEREGETESSQERWRERVGVVLFIY